MNTEDDRSRYSSGYSASRHSLTGGASHRRGGAHARFDAPRGAFGAPTFDDAGRGAGQTTYLSQPDDDDELEHPTPGLPAGTDIGLLVLRLVLGSTFILHGLQKLFGLLGGTGIDGFADMLQQLGFTQTTALSWVTGIAEFGGGMLVLLGLFTPLGASAILGVMATVIYLKIAAGTGFFMTPNQGFEWELGLAGTAFALMFAGPGRMSFDRAAPWYRNAGTFAITALIIAAVLTTVILLVFH